jgi:hypothetical protein
MHLGKFPLLRRSFVYRRCNFKRYVSDANSKAGKAKVITDLVSTLWRVSLILVLKRSLLKTG